MYVHNYSKIINQNGWFAYLFSSLVKIVNIFCYSNKTKVKKLRMQLHTPNKDKSTSMYLLDIRILIGTLVAIGSLVTPDEYIKIILDGISEEYDSFVTSVTSCLDP